MLHAPPDMGMAFAILADQVSDVRGTGGPPTDAAVTPTASFVARGGRTDVTDVTDATDATAARLAALEWAIDRREANALKREHRHA